jgi:hypothetical protein
MKTRTQMTLNPEFLPMIDKYINTAGLSRSGYIDLCIQSDVEKLDRIFENKSLTFDEASCICKEYFNSKIGEGGQ